MITLSLCMIVKNEEKVLPRCLDSVKNIADEIIIVDTGSSDHTVEIAGKYTDKIYHYKWNDDFSAARNFAFSKGVSDYLMWLDADDVLPERERNRLQELKKSISGSEDVIMLLYATAFQENGEPAFQYYRERIVKNRRGYLFRGRVHEAITPCGNIVYSDIVIEHRKVNQGNSRRNLAIYEGMEKRKEQFDGRALYYYGRELAGHGLYKRAVRIFNKFLRCPEGWTENKIDATRELAVCYYQLGNPEKAVLSLLKGLEYDVPRGETCCALGRYFMHEEKYEQAIFWYKQALSAKKAEKEGAFVEEECYGFLPAISLCVCYDRIGERDEAEKYNELAGKYKPDSPYYLSNKEYFSIY